MSVAAMYDYNYLIINSFLSWRKMAMIQRSFAGFSQGEWDFAVDLRLFSSIRRR